MRNTFSLLALLVAVPTTVILLYWLFIKNEDDEDEDNGNRVETSRQTVIQVTVPQKAVGAIIGRQGAVIREIQEESRAKVYFNDRDANRDSSGDRTATIRGTPETAQKAEVMIRKIIAEMPTIITEEVQVPGYCIGRLIGRGGENIREMSRSSNCKITIDKDSQGLHVSRTVSLTGSTQQVQLAKTMIKEKVLEEEQFRAKTAVNAGNREMRKPLKRHAEDGKQELVVSLPSKVVETEESWDKQRKSSILECSQVKEFMEVFVSAIEHPGHFWVQIITASSLQLDKLIDDMTAFYSNDDSSETYKVKDVKIGDIVAAPFEEDKTWYRARVVGFVDDKVDLYFIDFGDNCLVTPNQFRELRPEYLSLPVQAIECKLANIKPQGETWTDAACVKFEELSYCAQWKILSARTVGYEPTSSGQMPCLQLYDNSQDQVDLAAEMVTQGFAVWEYQPEVVPAPAETVKSDFDPHP